MAIAMLFKPSKKTSMVTEADVDQLYRRPVSLSDWLPWVDYDESSATFTLEDGFSAAAMFEVTGVSTEARSEQFLQEVQTNIQTCINHTIPAHDNPFVLQCFVSDEVLTIGLVPNPLKSMRKSTAGSPQGIAWLRKSFVALMQGHFKRMTQSAGLFEDTTVTGGSWRGKVRRGASVSLSSTLSWMTTNS